MRRDVREDWDWADRYLPVIKYILKKNAMHFMQIKVAPRSDDLKRATDMVLILTGGDIAVRVRRDDCKYRDLTIRVWRKGNTETEIHKIRSGLVRWYLYAWVQDDGYIGDWMIVDLDKMRSLGLLDEGREIIYNPDGRTGFMAYSQDELNDKDCLVANGSEAGQLSL